MARDKKEGGEKVKKFELKVPKGTKDWEGTDMVIRDEIFSKITSVFKRHGYTSRMSCKVYGLD
jgi:histidyl-tRNA synthetase